MPKTPFRRGDGTQNELLRRTSSISHQAKRSKMKKKIESFPLLFSFLMFGAGFHFSFL
jgi:hypothetical protein